jgi:phage terminase small subunit
MAAEIVKQVVEEVVVEPVAEEVVDVTDHKTVVDVKNITGGALFFENGTIEAGAVGKATLSEAFFQEAFVERV